MSLDDLIHMNGNLQKWVDIAAAAEWLRLHAEPSLVVAEMLAVHLSEEAVLKPQGLALL